MTGWVKNREKIKKILLYQTKQIFGDKKKRMHGVGNECIWMLLGLNEGERRGVLV